MKHFDNIINNLISIHKNPDTQYGENAMFNSANDLSIAISRLMDAQRIFSSESFDMKELSPEQFVLWSALREEMPTQTANDLALCFIKNTPLANTKEETEQLENHFKETIMGLTNSEELTHIFADIFFGEVEMKMPKMRDH